MLSRTDEIVAGITEKWSAGFRRLDAEALASLYSKSVFFFGSKSQLHRGQQGVADYFNVLPRWNSPTVQFDVVTAPVSPDVINAAGTASFVFDADGEPLAVKITWVIVREDGEWTIASHVRRRGRSVAVGRFVLRWFLHLFR